MEASTSGADGVGHGFDSFILADDALAEALLHLDELLDLALHELGDGDAGPTAHDFRDVLLVDLLLDQFCASTFAQRILSLGQLFFKLRNLVLEAGGAFPVGAQRSLLHLIAGGIQLSLQFAKAVELLDFLLPAGLELVCFLLKVGELLLDG